MREVIATKRQQLALERRAAVLPAHRLHDALHLFTHFLVGDAEHRDVEHLGVGDQQVLGLLGIDVHAAGHDHEVAPIGEVQVALVVDVAHVADRRPSLLVVRRRGLLRVLVVLERRRPFARLEPHDARFADGELGAVFVADVNDVTAWPPHRSRVVEPFGGGDERCAGCFSRAVVLVDDRAPPLQHALLHVDGTRCGRVHRVTERREVVRQALLVGQLEHADEHGRNQLRMGHAVPLDELEKLLGVEAFHDH